MRFALDKAQPFEVEILNYCADGRPFWNLLNVTPVFGRDGAPTSFVGFQTDITEKKKELARNEQVARAQSLGILAGGLAHEINNLLQPMITYPQFIREALPENADEALTGLSFIETHAHAAKSIVSQVLRFARSEAADLAVAHLPTKVGELVHQIAPTLPNAIQLRLKIDEPSQALLRAKVDDSGVRTLVSNMVQNSVDAIGDRSGNIMIEIYRHGDDVHIAFSDDGCGIPPDRLAFIFDPFFTTKSVGEGTGLGLALVAADIQRWGGSIVPSSIQGKGTRFDVSLPLASVEAPLNEPLAQVA